MESPLSLLRMHRDHEPLRLAEARSGPRVCDPQQCRFMKSSHGLLPCVAIIYQIVLVL